MSDWTSDTAARFTHLRLQEMSGQLSPTDQAELARLRAAVAAEEDTVITPALHRLAAEQQELETLLATTQTNNQQLQRLINQQSLLISDAKQWLQEFEQRYVLISDAYAQLNPSPFSPAP